MDTYLIKSLKICVVPGKEMQRSSVTEYSGGEVKKSFIEFPATYKIFIINDSDQDIKSIKVYSTGFDGSGEEFVMLEEAKKTFGAVKAKHALLLEELDFGLLDFVLNYELKINWTNEKRSKISFEIFKGYGLKKESMSFEPILNEIAYHMEIKECAKEKG